MDHVSFVVLVQILQGFPDFHRSPGLVLGHIRRFSFRVFGYTLMGEDESWVIGFVMKAFV
jgi:hypothetical protein